MRRIVINVVSIKEGGALVLLRYLLCEMVSLRPDWEWHVLTNGEARSSLAVLNNVHYHVVPEKAYGGWRIRLWYEAYLPKFIKSIKADLLFSQTNYLPTRKLTRPSLLLVQHAGHFSEVFKRLTEAQLAGFAAKLSWRLKGRWVISSIRRAQRVTVQTAALARQIVETTGVSPDKITVIPHGVGLAVAAKHLPSLPTAGKPVRIGYITKYGVQKNFDVVFRAVAYLKSIGIKVVLVLTLALDSPVNRAVLDAAGRYGIADQIENHGELAGEEVDRLYSSLHIFVFASLCESFGFPMVEALAHGLPLLIADVGSNVEVGGEAGLRFEPDDFVGLGELVRKLIENPEWYVTCARASRDRSTQFTWRIAALSTIEQMERLLEARRT
jgi:glycosyltransferase involved in cell wall biosynthesis